MSYAAGSVVFRIIDGHRFKATVVETGSDTEYLGRIKYDDDGKEETDVPVAEIVFNSEDSKVRTLRNCNGYH